MYSNDDFRRFLMPPPVVDVGQPLPPPPPPAPNPGLSPLDQRIFGLPAPGPSAPPPAPPPVPTPTGPAPSPPPSPLVASMFAKPAPAPKPATIGPAKIEADQAAAQDAQIAAAQQVAAAKGKAAQTEGEGLQKVAQDYRDAIQAKVDADKQAAEQTAAEKASYQADQQALANTKVNPDRLVQNMSTWQKIVGAISIGLGGFAAAAANRGSGGGPNLALQIIESQIQRDINAQMADLETKKGALQAKGTMLQMDIADRKDASMARLQTAQLLRQNAVDEIQAQVKMLGTEQAAAEGAQLIAGIKATGAQQEQAFWAQKEQINNAKAQTAIAGGQLQLARQREGREAADWAAKLPGQLAGQKLDLEGKAAETELRKAQAQAALAKKNTPTSGQPTPEGLTPKEARALEVHGADGSLIGYANDDTTAREARKQIGSYEDFRKDLTDYRKMAEENGREFGGVPGVGWGKTEAYRLMEGKQKRLLVTLKDLGKLGALSESDMKLIEAQIPGPQSWLSGQSPVPSLNEAIAHGDAAIDRYVRINIPGAQRYSPPSDEERAAERKAAGAVDNGLPPAPLTKTQQAQAYGKAVGADPTAWGEGPGSLLDRARIQREKDARDAEAFRQAAGAVPAPFGQPVQFPPPEWLRR